MLDLIKELHLGQWTTAIVAITLLWQLVLKSAFESWLKSRLDLQKQQVSNALAIQKDLVIKEAEFEKVKLERVLPLLETINSAISEHEMMFYNYANAIRNKISYRDDLEELRLEQDKKINEAISSIGIYLPSEFRILLYRIRKIMSCSWKESLTEYRLLKNIGGDLALDVPYTAQDLYSDLIDCFYSMCNKYIGTSDSEGSYEEILHKHDLDKKAVTKKEDPVSQLAWKNLLLHEYYGDQEKMDAQSNLEKYYGVKRRYV